MSHSVTIYQVSELSNEMRRLMERSYPEIWIEGELSSLSAPASGHLYFSLKDNQSQLRCAMFKGRASINRYKPKAGDLVRVRAKISVYTARGDLQCIVQHIEEAGEGLLQRRFEELKTKLNAQGLFDQAHKKDIPRLPKHIGLITSASGAAVKDILTTLKRRCPGIPVTIYPTVVQGDTAAKNIIDAINNSVQHQKCDVLVLTRGGGSIEDLWCFNDEQLAQSIFNCPIPIVSGVGHEVDITIADLVADLRAPTPTAAAEMISPDTSHLLANLQSLNFRLPRSMQRLVERKTQLIDMTTRQLVHPRQQLKQNQLKLETSSKRMSQLMQQRLSQHQSQLRQSQQRFKTPITNSSLKKQKINNLGQRFKLANNNNHKQLIQQFSSLSEQLHLVSPLATINRGFSIARDQNDKILRSKDQVEKNQMIEVQLSDGKLNCTCLLYTSPSPRDQRGSRMPSSA